MKRNGNDLRRVPAGDRRRMSDGRNAVRKMTPEQRDAFLQWIAEEFPEAVTSSGISGTHEAKEASQ